MIHFFTGNKANRLPFSIVSFLLLLLLHAKCNSKRHQEHIPRTIGNRKGKVEVNYNRGTKEGRPFKQEKIVKLF